MRFARLTNPAPVRPIRFTFEGRRVEAQPGDSIATALLAAGSEMTRETAVSGETRAPYCLMGVCFECLVEVDGVPNRQACLVPVAEGMTVNRQRGAPSIDGDG